MDFNIKLTKHTIKAPTKYSLLNKLNLGCMRVSSSVGNCYNHPTKAEYVRVFNLEKHRKRATRITKGKNKGNYKITKESHWVAFYYDIPEALLVLGNKTIRQKLRNFEISNK